MIIIKFILLQFITLNLIYLYEHDYIKKVYEPLGYTIHGGKAFNAKFKNPMSHGDALFAILKPGVILTYDKRHMVKDSLFANWDIHVIEGYDAIDVLKEGWKKIKNTKRIYNTL